jgi:predicted transposase YdaD
MRTIAQQIEKRGMEKEKTEIAKAMLIKGLSADLVKEVTKLPKQAIDQLMKK